MAAKKQNFEGDLARLEEIVKSLERGDVSLSDSMKLFEEGSKLLRSCGDALDKAEQQVVKLRKGENGEPEELAFDTEE